MSTQECAEKIVERVIVNSLQFNKNEAQIVELLELIAKEIEKQINNFKRE